MKYYEQNQAKLKELKPEYQFALDQFLVDADAQGLEFRVTEGYRSQERQNQLYAQRPRVTWTLTSNHTKRSAFDVHAINCSYEDIERVANTYGIFRDPKLVKLGDLGHFDVVHPLQPPSPVNPEYRLQGLLRRLQTTSVVSIRDSLYRLISRLKARLKDK